MATSTCIKCSGTSFQVVEKEPRDAKYKYVFVQCSGCGGVVGVVEWLHTGTQLQKLERLLDEAIGLAKDVRGVTSQLPNALNEALRLLRSK